MAVRPPYNFARLRFIFERDGIDLFLNGTVLRLEMGNGNEVVAAVCQMSDGRTARVRARKFVLATGGIENPRLLLASGLGNEHDQVGRCFMNHPKGYAGRLILRKPLPITSPYLPRSVNGRMIYAGLVLSEDTRRARGLLSSYVQFEPDLGFLQRYAFGIWRRLPTFIAPLFNLLRPRTLRLRWYADMEPRTENYIRLGERKDMFGMPLPAVTYALGPRDAETLRTLHAQLTEEIDRLGLGRVEGSADAVVAAASQDASHYLGGTRMGRNPRTSVVDPNCKVHTISNLYIAGGSVFATSGSANPTYTIIALAIRLAKHLKQELMARSA